MKSKTLSHHQVSIENSTIVQDRLVTVADLFQFQEKLLKEMKWLLSQKHTFPEKQWLKSGEVRKLLQISPGTLQHLRDTGQLPFTKLGGIIYYDRNVIQSRLQKLRKE